MCRKKILIKDENVFRSNDFFFVLCRTLISVTAPLPPTSLSDYDSDLKATHPSCAFCRDKLILSFSCLFFFFSHQGSRIYTRHYLCWVSITCSFLQAMYQRHKYTYWRLSKVRTLFYSSFSSISIGDV